MSQLLFTRAPHLRTDDTVLKRTWLWNISLLPIAVGALGAFGVNALAILIFSIAGAALGEVFSRIVAGASRPGIRGARCPAYAATRVRPDGKAIYIGLLSALLGSPHVSPWVSLAGAFLATAVAQECFGGRGASVFHPALVAFAVSQLLSSASPTVLSGNAFLFQIAGQADVHIEAVDFLWGVRSGALGEASLLMTFAGSAVLLGTRMISLWLPALFLGSVLGTSLLIHAHPTAEWLIGSTLLAAFYIVTDYETSPLNRYGKYVYAVLSGFSFVMLRHGSGKPDTALYGLLILNCFSPLLDHWFVRLRPKSRGPFRKGEKRD